VTKAGLHKYSSYINRHKIFCSRCLHKVRPDKSVYDEANLYVLGGRKDKKVNK